MNNDPTITQLLSNLPVSRRKILGVSATLGAVGALTSLTSGLFSASASAAEAVGSKTASRILIERTPRWVRARFGEVFVGNTQQALFVHEQVPNGWKAPAYLFPEKDIRQDLLVFSGVTETPDRAGLATFYHVNVGGKVYQNAAFRYEDPSPGAEALKGHIGFVWKKVDQWFEEEEVIYQHPRDPYHRVDAIPSSRHIKVVLGGKVIAESRRPVIVYETGLRPRYYLPKVDIHEEFLERTELHTRCPYKGEASYWSATVDGKAFENIVWAYPQPFPDVQNLSGLLSFYNEKVDAVYVDDVKEQDQVWNGGNNVFYV